MRFALLLMSTVACVEVPPPDREPVTRVVALDARVATKIDARTDAPPVDTARHDAGGEDASEPMCPLRRSYAFKVRSTLRGTPELALSGSQVEFGNCVRSLGACGAPDSIDAQELELSFDEASHLFSDDPDALQGPPPIKVDGQVLIPLTPEDEVLHIRRDDGKTLNFPSGICGFAWYIDCRPVELSRLRALLYQLIEEHQGSFLACTQP